MRQTHENEIEKQAMRTVYIYCAGIEKFRVDIILTISGNCFDARRRVSTHRNYRRIKVIQLSSHHFLFRWWKSENPNITAALHLYFILQLISLFVVRSQSSIVIAKNNPRNDLNFMFSRARARECVKCQAFELHFFASVWARVCLCVICGQLVIFRLFCNFLWFQFWKKQ